MALYKRETNVHTGVTTELHTHLDGFQIVDRVDVTEILEQNKRLANSPTKRRDTALGDEYARIPNVIAFKWLREEGLDIYSKEPSMRRRLFRKLNDPEWRYLKCTTKKVWA